MSLTATTLGSWTGTIDTNRLVMGRDHPGAPRVLEEGYHWEANEYVIHMERAAKGVTAYTPEIGGTSGGNLLAIVNGADTLAGNSAQSYTCTDDRLEPDPPGSALWRQTQVWRTVTGWSETPNE
jgi:hypothetical protein